MKTTKKITALLAMGLFASSLVFADEIESTQEDVSYDTTTFEAGDDYVLGTAGGTDEIENATWVKDITSYTYNENTSTYSKTTVGVYAYYIPEGSDDGEGGTTEADAYTGYVGESTSTAQTGGAVNNASGSTDEPTVYASDFIGNYASTTANSTSTYYGGAISNAGTATITGDFISNYVSNYAASTVGDTITKYGYGGAIYNASSITSITGNFTDNYVKVSTAVSGATNTATTYAQGGAIYNSSAATIGEIKGYFSANTVYSYAYNSNGNGGEQSYAQGGAIYNDNSITSISGSFLYNEAEATTQGSNALKNKNDIITAQGGAIYNNTGDSIGSITGDFTANSAYSWGFNFSTGSTKTVTIKAQGGAIYNAGTIVAADEDGDSAATYGIVGNFTDNYAFADATVPTDNTTKSSNKATITSTAQGGAIYNSSSLDVEGSFTGNFAVASAYLPDSTNTTTSAQGGAVYNSGTVTFNASANTSYSYTGNFATTTETTTSTALDLDDVTPSADDDANGGFLYQASGGVTNFNTEEGASIIIGLASTDSDYAVGYDSIAGLGTINKNGAGSLVVNSSMEYYTGTLNVSAGSMEVNNTLSASVISIESGASLSVDILAIYLGETSSLSLTNEGTLSIDTLAIYLTVDFVEDFNVYLNEEDYDISANIANYELYDSNGDLIDNSSYVITDGYLSFATAVPEPSTYAMILGALALGFAYYRRRK